MTQVARNLTDHVDGFVRDKKLLILDNDALFAKRFCSTLENGRREDRAHCLPSL